MTIEELRRQRGLAEGQVLEALQRFQEETGLCIVSCEVHTASHRTLGGLIRPVMTGVSLTIEPI